MGKYGPEKTPYLDTFYTVKVGKKIIVLCRISSSMSLEKRRILMKKLIESQFNYCPLTGKLIESQFNYCPLTGAQPEILQDRGGFM